MLSGGFVTLYHYICSVTPLGLVLVLSLLSEVSLHFTTAYVLSSYCFFWYNTCYQEVSLLFTTTHVLSSLRGYFWYYPCYQGFRCFFLYLDSFTPSRFLILSLLSGGYIAPYSYLCSVTPSGLFLIGRRGRWVGCVLAGTVVSVYGGDGWEWLLGVAVKDDDVIF